MIPRVLLLLALGNLLSSTCQTVTTPLFVNALGRDQAKDKIGDPFFVVMFVTFLWMVVPLCWDGLSSSTSSSSNTDTCVRRRYSQYRLSRLLHGRVFAVACLWTVSFLLTTFASSEGRTPPDVQAILVQANFPVTFLTRILLLRKDLYLRYSSRQLLAALIILGGIVCSLVSSSSSSSSQPSSLELTNTTATPSSSLSSSLLSLSSLSEEPLYLVKEDGSSKVDFVKALPFARGQGQGMIWSLIFLLGVSISAATNVMEENLFKDSDDTIDIGPFTFWCNFYQLVLTSCLFWVNVVPGFGLFHDIRQWWWDGFCASASAMTKLLTNPTIPLLGLLNGLSGLGAFFTAVALTRESDSNCVGIIGSAATSIAVSFWVVTKELTWVSILLDYLGCALIMVGFCLYIHERTQLVRRVDDCTHSYSAIQEPLGSSIVNGA